MALSILGGVARGITLDVPKGDNVRPTSVMLRRKLFDAHQNLDDLVFIDLCAGTGAMGIEAWSRAAAQLYLIESDARTQKQLQNNVKKISDKFDREYRTRPIIIKKDNALSWLNTFKQQYSGWDEDKRANTILFFDPPYEKKELYAQIVSESLLDWFTGRVWVESDRQKGLPAEHWEIWGERFVKTYFQGTSYIAVLDLRSSIG